MFEDGDCLCSGGCSKGGDRFAEKFAKQEGTPIIIFYPNYKKYGKPAAFIRNSKIAETSHMIVACVVNPQDGIKEVLKRKVGGTEDTLRKFVKYKEHNIERVILV